MEARTVSRESVALSAGEFSRSVEVPQIGFKSSKRSKKTGDVSHSTSEATVTAPIQTSIASGCWREISESSSTSSNYPRFR